MVQVRLGDITQEPTDAIVNAANARLMHGGGVAGAISSAGGSVIDDESDEWVRKHGVVPVGEAAITRGGRLPAKFVIHAVGPVWTKGSRDEKQQLHEAVWNSLLMAHNRSLRSIAIPAISSGIFGFPKNLCARILIKTALTFYKHYPETSLHEIRFTNFDQKTVDIFEEMFNTVLAKDP